MKKAKAAKLAAKKIEEKAATNLQNAAEKQELQKRKAALPTPAAKKRKTARDSTESKDTPEAEKKTLLC